MVDAQEQIIGVPPDWHFVASRTDRDIALFKQLVEKLFRENGAPSQSMAISI
jgi:hypothetical protein